MYTEFNFNYIIGRAWFGIRVGVGVGARGGIEVGMEAEVDGVLGKLGEGVLSGNPVMCTSKIVQYRGENKNKHSTNLVRGSLTNHE